MDSIVSRSRVHLHRGDRVKLRGRGKRTGTVMEVAEDGYVHVRWDSSVEDADTPHHSELKVLRHSGYFVRGGQA